MTSLHASKEFLCATAVCLLPLHAVASRPTAVTIVNKLVVFIT